MAQLSYDARYPSAIQSAVAALAESAYAACANVANNHAKCVVPIDRSSADAIGTNARQFSSACGKLPCENVDVQTR